jgi:hypothetical protein
MGSRQLAGLMGLVVAATSGCVTAYQPLSGLQRPTVIDIQAPNLEGLRLRVDCVIGDFLDRREAETLCRRVSALFTNQGAKVSTTFDLDAAAPERAAGKSRAAAPPPAESAPAASVRPSYDLSVQLSTRLLHEETNQLLWVLSFMTFTLAPATAEYTFAQDVLVRDETGFLLASETLTARLVRHFGLGYWGLNRVLDWTREEPDRLFGDAGVRRLSRDFYRQLSQLLFNARMRLDVLSASRGGVARTP